MLRLVALKSGGVAPYAPPGTVTEVLKRYRDRGLPKPLTAEVLERAGVSGTLSSRTLQALKLLEFVDAEGNPSDAFEAVCRAPEQDYRQRLGEMLRAQYAEVLLYADPATDPYDRVRDAFRGFNPQGQQERMVTLFLGLLDYVGENVAAAASSRRRSEQAPSMPPRQRQRPERRPAATPRAVKKQTVTPLPDRSSREDAALVAWFDTRPPAGTAWAMESRDAFLKTLRAIIDGIYSEPGEGGETEATWEGEDLKGA